MTRKFHDHELQLYYLLRKAYGGRIPDFRWVLNKREFERGSHEDDHVVIRVLVLYKEQYFEHKYEGVDLYGPVERIDKTAVLSRIRNVLKSEGDELTNKAKFFRVIDVEKRMQRKSALAVTQINEERRQAAHRMECPSCDAHVVPVEPAGNKAPFWGCSRFPLCKGSLPWNIRMHFEAGQYPKPLRRSYPQRQAAAKSAFC